MPILDYLTGFNHRLPTLGAQAAFTNGATVDTATVRRTGGSSLKLTASASVGSWRSVAISANALAAIAYINFSVLPTTSKELLILTEAAPSSTPLAGIGFDASAGQFCIYHNAGGNTFVNAAGPSVVTGSWYRIETGVDASANVWQVNGQVAIGDGTATAFTSATPTMGSIPTSFSVDLGSQNSSTFTAFFTDLAWSEQLADYPIGPIQVYGYSPNAVGTHNLDAATSSYFFSDTSAPPGSAGTALTTSETTSYQDIDEVPIDSGTDAVKVTPATTTTSGQSSSGATTAASVSGTWTSITNAQGAPQNTVGTAFTTTNAASVAPAKSGSAVMSATGFGLSGTVTALTVNVRAAASATGVTGETIQIDLYNSTTLVSSGTAQTINQTAYKDWTQTFSSVSVPASSLTIRVTVARGNTNTSYTAAIDAVALASVTTTTTTQPTNTLYAEYNFADETTLTQAPLAVRAIVGQELDTAVASTWAAKLYDSVQGSNTEDVSNGTISATTKTYVGKTFNYRPGGGADNLIDDQSGIDLSTSTGWGSTSQPEIAQTITGYSTSLSAVTFTNLNKVGSPSDSAVLNVCPDSSGAPGSVLASASVLGSTFVDSGTGNGPITFVLSSPVVLNAATTYWLVLTRSGALDNTNRYGANLRTTNPPGGQGWVFNGTTWSSLVSLSSTRSLRFKLYSALWTLAALNGTRLRFGYTNAASGDPRLAAAMLEAGFPPAVAASLIAHPPHHRATLHRHNTMDRW